LTRPALSLAAALSLLAFSDVARVGAQTKVFKGAIEMVPLTVTVTDASGKYVTGLTDSDFTVFEDGIHQPLSFFASDEIPLDVGFVVDTSASMRPDLALVKQAASGLIQRMREGDRGAVVEVKGAARIPQPFTGDHALVQRAIQGLSTSGNTALYDGLYVILRTFETERRQNPEMRRQVLVLLTDGVDNGSHLSFDDVMDLARRVGVNIYIIAIRDQFALGPRQTRQQLLLQAEYSMRTVAREAGGRSFFPKSSAELPAIYAAIADELANQYELGYVPSRTGGDGGFRRVMVRVPPAVNASARTRSGYYASRTSASGERPRAGAVTDVSPH
jgi:Ca-activated chloride channel homolog